MHIGLSLLDMLKSRAAPAPIGKCYINSTIMYVVVDHISIDYISDLHDSYKYM